MRFLKTPILLLCIVVSFYSKNADASDSITLVKYADLECPYGKAIHPHIKSLVKKYGDKISFEFKTMPLDYHPTAQTAARIFHALKLQNSKVAYKFYDSIYENQVSLKSNQGNIPYLMNMAEKVGADIPRLKSDMETEQIYSLVKENVKEALSFGVHETPGVVVNGIAISGFRPTFEQMDKLIASQLD
jgi:protein-disulfide isomerase